MERLYGLTLPVQGVAVDGEKGKSNFADLLPGQWGSLEKDGSKTEGKGKLTRRENGSFRSRRSVERW